MEKLHQSGSSCPNCWGHQEYAAESKSLTELTKRWIRGCRSYIGWIQRHVERYFVKR